MRILKFKAWDKVKEEWIYSDNVAGGMWRYFKELENRGIRHFESKQYIEKEDRNGIEIYDGDIVNLIPDGYTVIIGIVQFDADGGHWRYHRPDQDVELFLSWQPVEIIGNTQETPELLK